MCKGQFQSKNPEAFEHLKTKLVVQCDNCSKKILRMPSELKNTKHSFCGHSCKAEFQSKKER